MCLCALNHRRDRPRRVEAAADPRLPDFNAALPFIVYAHRDGGVETALTLKRVACACCVDTHGAKGLRCGHDRRATGAHHGTRRAGYRFQRWQDRKRMPPGEEFVGDDSNSLEIGGLARRMPLQHFGGHVGKRAAGG